MCALRQYWRRYCEMRCPLKIDIASREDENSALLWTTTAQQGGGALPAGMLILESLEPLIRFRVRSQDEYDVASSNASLSTKRTTIARCHRCLCIGWRAIHIHQPYAVDKL
jgi:hypothetical protein